MKKYTLSTSSSYDILIGDGILKDCGSLLSQLFSPRRAVVITDSTVNALFSGAVTESLKAAGFNASRIVFPAGEHSKNLTTFSNILEALADDGFTRSDLVVALGGGVVSDVSGMVAATYMRGVPYVLIPTTLQCALDAAIGGSAGLNLLNGKNLAGVYYQPSLVICDPETFASLSEDRIRDGLAEALKCAAVSDAALIPRIKAHDYSYILERCISIKKSLVEVDERAQNLRQLLSFGHTLGHGIEKLSSYGLSHGQAVAKGMIAESRGAYLAGHTTCDISQDLEDILDELGFDTTLDYSPDDLYHLALRDYKIQDGKINMVIPSAMGKCTLKKISLDELKHLIALGVSSSPLW